MSYPLDTKLKAQTLYVHDQLSQEEVAALTGVSLSTVKSWAAEGNWSTERDRTEKQILAINSSFMDSLAEMARELATDKNPQRAHAVTNMMRMMPSARRLSASIERAEISKVIVGGILEHLQEHAPEIYDTASKAILAFVDSKRELFQLRSSQVKALREQVATTAAKLADIGKKHGIDPATIKQIREEIYGLIDYDDAA